MSDFVFVYITTGSEDEAMKIARALVEGQHAACANVIPGMRSVYAWENAIEEADEFIVIAKTRADLFDKVEEIVKDLHSYTCPCIVALPILAGSPEFLKWIDESTMES